ncbi:hypothetical protein B0H14DRAFT_2621511 [Mycena olivaceomarginata]|nr:hypothetical protein B0H14DRAFT_2621511 [Mycena olivaceomarginata]
MSRMRHVDHLRPRHFQRELRAGSCDLPVIWKSAVRKAKAILAKMVSGWEFPLLFASSNQKPTYYAHLERNIQPSRARLTAPWWTPSAPTTDSESFAAVGKAPYTLKTITAGVNVMRHIEECPHNCLLVTLSTIVVNVSKEDQLGRIERARTRENGEGNQTLSASTHFQLGNLFKTLICYNNTHLALAIAKCTLIKKGPTGSKASSISAVPRAELDLPDSVYTISGQVLSVVPLGRDEDSPAFAWDGNLSRSP